MRYSVNFFHGHDRDTGFQTSSVISYFGDMRQAIQNCDLCNFPAVVYRIYDNEEAQLIYRNAYVR